MTPGLGKPVLSVVVPLYNKERYIDRCLESILGQTCGDFELIVVNDGSTDSSADKVRAYQDPRLRVLEQANAGPGAARNHGLREARCEIVAFLDGDDAWEKDYLARSLARFEQLGDGVAALNWGMRIYPGKQTTEERWKRTGVPEGLFRATPHTARSTMVAILANMLPSSSVLRRKPALAADGFYAKYRCLFSEDAHLYLRLLLRHEVYFDPSPLTLRYEDASELALGHQSARPIEPFLLDPEDLRRDCPAAMRDLLEKVLASRALKTAAVYGYWGETSRARQLFEEFGSLGRDWRLPYYWAGLVAGTPAGKAAGAILRAIRGRT